MITLTSSAFTMQSIDTTRRNFLKTTGLAGVGLMLGFSGFGKDVAVKKLATGPLLDLEINPFILIKTDGSITLINPRPDMRQGSTQAAPSLIAEELEVRLDQVSLIQSDGRDKYGSQQSGGSSTVRELWTPLRQAGAAAKEMMTEVAAQRWNVAVTDCYAREGKIWLKNSDKSFSYGELVEDASKLPVPSNPVLKDPKDFKILGKYNKRLDVPSRVTGQAVYGIDIELPGMVYACILHAPMIHGKVVSIDDTEAKKIPGVLEVVKTQRPMPHRRADAVVSPVEEQERELDQLFGDYLKQNPHPRCPEGSLRETFLQLWRQDETAPADAVETELDAVLQELAG